MSQLTMSSHKKAQLPFASAVVMLCLSGLATYIAVVRLMQSEKWVVHTHDVQLALGSVDSAVLNAGRACSSSTSKPNHLAVRLQRPCRSRGRIRRLTPPTDAQFGK
jgi:hypothetical protein